MRSAPWISLPRITAVAASAFLVSGGSCLAESVDLEPVEDVSILYAETWQPRHNFVNGGAAPLAASLHGGAPNRGGAALLRFDVSRIPPGAVIEKAELILTPLFSYGAADYASNERLVVYQLAAENSGWVEGTGDSLKSPETESIAPPGATGAYVNLESYTDEENNQGVRWLSGRLIGAMDFAGDELGRLSLRETGLVEAEPVVVPLRPEDLQAWLQDPDLARAGLVLWMTSDEKELAVSRFAIFQSREQPHPPLLTITYRLP